MERESFENHEVAELLNDAFVCIKVDREERPDIDNTYMRVSQLMTGRGGWPLTILLTPDKRPFFAATYIPRENRFGRVGLKELIPTIQKTWTTKRHDVYDLAEAYLNLSDNFDERDGGFGGAPKFPSPQRLIFLLRYWKRTGKGKALRMVEETLGAMRRGGIYDHVGFGFHRYSTDREWRVPHFEKMLYDQAMLTIAYVEAFQVTGMEEYEETAREILSYVLRDMKDSAGGFYSAEDADIGGEEGIFYLWTDDEIRLQLPLDEAEFVINVLNVTKNGNFEEESTRRKMGKNILHHTKPFRTIAHDQNVSVKELKERWEKARVTLYTARESRVHPSKDDKILVDWNGLMIVALAKASQAFNSIQYMDAAKGAVNFVFENMLDTQGRLLHRYREGEAAIPGFLNDYAFLIWGLLELYETTFEVKYLKHAISFNEDMIRHFWDEKEGGFYFSAKDAENVLVRNKEIHDGAYPSGNSIATYNLLRLARMTGKTEYEAKAAQMLQTFSDSVSQAPAAHTSLMNALDFALGPSYEVVVVGKRQNQDTKGMLNELKTRFIPNKIVLFRPAEEEYPEIAKYAEFTRDLSSLEGKATAYVCRNYQCDFPTILKEEMLRSLDALV
jgi:uncharacterized protein YyaL (SSP411 family)